MAALARKLVDVHCHLQDQKIIGNVEDIVRAAVGKNITAACVNATKSDDWTDVLSLHSKFPSFIIPSIGIHPFYAREYENPDVLSPASSSESPSWVQEMKSLLSSNPLICVGECGLDKAFQKVSEAQMQHQQAIMEAQLELAHQFNRPASVHCVRAPGPLLESLKRLQSRKTHPSRLLIHSFSGSCDTAKELSHRFECYLSFSANIASPHFAKAREAIAVCRPDRLLIETDSPCQTPSPSSSCPVCHQPFPDLILSPVSASTPCEADGKSCCSSQQERLNTPANLPIALHVAACVLRISEDELAATLMENSKRFFAGMWPME